jgi:membrane protein YqaA with SNARE-associated domain
LDLSYIFLYSAACAIFLPLPSEAPMFLFPNLSRVTVLVVCALGKGCGAYIIFLSGDWISQSGTLNRLVKMFGLERLWIRLLAWSNRIMKSYGLVGFLMLMSLPGMPMRSAIYSFSILRINGVVFALGVAIGTVVRNSLVYFGYVGIKSLLS